MKLTDLFENDLMPAKVLNLQTARLLRAAYDKLEAMAADVSMLTVSPVQDADITCDFYCGIEMSNPPSSRVKPELNALLKKYKLKDALDFTTNTESEHIVYEFASTDGNYTDYSGLKAAIESAFHDKREVLNLED